MLAYAFFGGWYEVKGIWLTHGLEREGEVMYITCAWLGQHKWLYSIYIYIVNEGI